MVAFLLKHGESRFLLSLRRMIERQLGEGLCVEIPHYLAKLPL